ncbi:hypothetical protein PCYB_115360 [Plasmodium cynomolgi strain B]|uniref:JmjC domain-containing protein n=1 Tax=Plasmodium cynomolgi (strain B) TaxID=1120755 RepID=K6UE06_PLACD|nr:hypothetical protein PCYB_115360 [Plasmodium cynomolgi strain B]GAB67516.1 hypothetical protein PCYB_115360 [Plasmodium cynomolgi strain B]
MKSQMPVDFHEYCQLIEKKVKRISPDEVETAKLFEKLITKYNIKKVKRVCLPLKDGNIYSPSSDSFFNDHYVANKPLIITNLGHKIGKCTETYSNKNVIEHIGNTKVSIHIGTSKFLNNINKNFRYKLSSLTNFIQLIGEEDKKKSRFSLRYDEGGKEMYLLLCKAGDRQHNLPPHQLTVETTNQGRDNQTDENQQKRVNGEKCYYYYRSLGTNQFKDVSNIKKMNHFIRDSFFLPAQIYPPHDEFEIGQTNIFIWLHYDIPDNFLIQVKGRKKILLIPPKFIKYFQIVNSSSPYNLFHILMGRKKLSKREKVVKKVLCKFALVADLYQGDILFIPSLWMHYVYNMPAHTYVKRKYKSYHQHLRVETEEESVQFDAQNKWEGKYHSLGRKFLNRFTPLKRVKYAPVMGRYPRDKRNKPEIKLLPQWGNIPLRDNTNEESSNISSEITQDELIQHYSHLENYQHFLEHHFGIRISDIEERSARHEHHANCNEDIKRGQASNRHTCSSAKLNISVNYFFRKRKERLLFSKKDLYGNQDIILASQLFKKIQQDIEPLLAAPPKYKNFYLQKLQGVLYSHLDDQYV